MDSGSISDILQPLQDSAFRTLSDQVYEGVWERHAEPAFRRKIWTLLDSRALLTLACLTMLFAYAQTRAWVFFRYVVFTRVKPVRLGNDTTDGPDPLLHLSQGKAIAGVLPTILHAMKRLWIRLQRALRTRTVNQNALADADDAVISPYFGVFALLNVALFLSMGVAAPWFLSEGALESPVVKSKLMDECLKSSSPLHTFSLINQLPKPDAIFQQCLDQLNQGCDSQYHLRKPQIRKTRLEACPFPGNICRNGTRARPFEIKHENITPYELGINSKSTLTLDHSLTCAPVHLHSFWRTSLELWHQNRSFISIGNFNLTIKDPIIYTNFSLLLNTLNGPSILTKESSGLQMAQEGGPHDFTVLPDFVFGSGELSKRPELMHDDLRRDDGMSFLLLYRAGASKYQIEIDDPFLAAHNKVMIGNFEGFYADYEATAMACLEQFRYCLPASKYCTPWGSGSTHAPTVAYHPTVDPESFMELVATFKHLPSMLSIYSYLAQRTGWWGVVPLTRMSTWKDMWTTIANPAEQWVTEVETWFMKSLLLGIFYVQNGGRFHLTFDKLPEEYLYPGADRDFKKHFSLCHRVLFRDPAYTNINWIGFWATAAVLVFVSFMSGMVQWIHETAKKPPSNLTRAHHFLVMKSSAATARLMFLVQNSRGRVRKLKLWNSRLGFSKSLSVFPAFQRVRGLLRRRHTEPERNGSQLDDIPSVSASFQNGSDDDERDEEVDHPI